MNETAMKRLEGYKRREENQDSHEDFHAVKITSTRQAINTTAQKYVYSSKRNSIGGLRLGYL